MRLERALAQVGITRKKARVYLAALELGEVPVTVLARKAGIGRTTAYDVVQRLAKDGLLVTVKKQGRFYVSAEEPARLVRLLEERQSALNGLLPELKSIYNRSTVKPRIRFYEGIEGLRTVLEDTLDCRRRELDAVLSMADLREAPGHQDEYIARRVARGIRLRVVRSRVKEIGDGIWPTSETELRELRYAPNGLVFGMTTWIYDDKVSFISSLRENFGMIIESSEFCQLMRNLFTVLWQASTPASGGHREVRTPPERTDPSGGT